MTPLPNLPEFASHKEKLLSWMSVQKSIKKAKLRPLLPRISGHFSEKGAFTMDHFVVREGKAEIFGIGIEEAKGKLMMLILPVYRIRREVGKGVMHPAHIPFQPKT